MSKKVSKDRLRLVDRDDARGRAPPGVRADVRQVARPGRYPGRDHTVVGGARWPQCAGEPTTPHYVDGRDEVELETWAAFAD
jgi:hypothetical protein